MKCEETRETIAGYLFNVTERESLAHAFHHYQHCQDCRRRMAQYDQITEALHPIATPSNGHVAGHEDRLKQDVYPRRWRFRKYVAMAAGFLLLISGYYGVGLLEDNSTPPTKQSSLFVLTQEEINKQRAIFEQVSKVFDNQLGWVASASSDAGMGLAHHKVPRDSTLFVMRFCLEADHDQSYISDLAILSGESAQLEIDLNERSRVRYSIMALDGNQNRVVLQMEMYDPQQSNTAIASLRTELQLTGPKMIEVGEIRTLQGSYQMRMAFSPAMAGEKTT